MVSAIEAARDVSAELTEADVELWKAVLDSHFHGTGNMAEAIDHANEAINALRQLRLRIGKPQEAGPMIDDPA